MSCLLTQGFALDCKNDQVGIDAIYLVEWNSSDTTTKASGEVTVHTLASSRVYFKWEMESETAEYTEKIIPSRENGSVAYEAEVKGRLYGMSTAKRNELKLMAKTRMRCIVKDLEGVYKLLGTDKGVTLQETTGAAGKGLEDFKGYEIVLKHREADLPLKLQTAVVTSLSLT